MIEIKCHGKMFLRLDKQWAECLVCERMFRLTVLIESREAGGEYEPHNN